MDNIIKGLIENFNKTFLFQKFNVKPSTWWQHKRWISTDGLKGQKLSSNYDVSILSNYEDFLKAELVLIDIEKSKRC